jgi:hypothetical protein
VLHDGVPFLTPHRVVSCPALEAAGVGIVIARAAEHEILAAPGVHVVGAGPRVNIVGTAAAVILSSPDEPLHLPGPPLLQAQDVLGHDLARGPVPTTTP